MAVLGFDLAPLRSAISELGQGLRNGAQQAGQAIGQVAGGNDYLGFLGHLAPAPSSPRPALPTGPLLAPDYLGQLAFWGGQQGGLGMSPAASFTSAPSPVWDQLNAYASNLANALRPPAPPPTATIGSTVTGGGPSTGMSPDVAKWASQAQQTFGGLVDPDIMLAIMTNESGGSPTAYNKAGNAWGLFQQVGLGSNDPNVQFQAARQLAQEKLTGINAAYAKNGLNPDERTRALDFALAWAGHFDYGTGRQNPNSVDNLVGGQTSQQFANIFLGNYDKIKAGRQQAPAGGGSGLAGVTPGTSGQIMQEFGPTDYAAAHPSTYAYGNAYGLQGSQHPGVDWAVPSGTRVASPLAGVVSVVGNDHGTGYYYNNPGNADPDHSGEFAITLSNGDILILGHMSRINVAVGQQINAGDLIGLSGGSDGDHVHVEYRRKNADGGYTIIDPRTVLGG